MRKTTLKRGESGKFKGSRHFFFHYLCRCLPGALLDEKKVYVCPLFMINIKNEPYKEENFSIYTFPTFSTAIFYNIQKKRRKMYC